MQRRAQEKETRKASARLPLEVIKRIQRIHIHSNYLVNDILAGEYESAFRGRGMEFEEVREYQPGDDVRDIDWNVTARMGHPYVKLYREERELTILLLVDVSNSGQFGSGMQLKNELSAELAAVLAYAAVKNNEKECIVLGAELNQMGYRYARLEQPGCIACGLCFYCCPEFGAITVYKKK